MTPEEFKTIRASLALTQAELGALLGVGITLTVTRYETGERSIPEHTARMMQLLRDVPEVYQRLQIYAAEAKAEKKVAKRAKQPNALNT